MAKEPSGCLDELGADDDDPFDISRLEALQAEFDGKWDASGDYAKYQIIQRLRAEMANWPDGVDALGEALWVMRRRKQFPIRNYDSDAEVARSMAYLILDLDTKRAPVIARAMAAIEDADADDTARILMESGGFDKLAARGKADARKALLQPRKAASPPKKRVKGEVTILVGSTAKKR